MTFRYDFVAAYRYDFFSDRPENSHVQLDSDTWKHAVFMHVLKKT